MKRSNVVLLGLAAVLTSVAVGLSCADSETQSCDLVECIAQCQSSGRAGGECRENSCFCNDVPPADADADNPDIPDVPPDVPPDVTPDDTLTDDVTSDDVRPEDVRPEDVRPEDVRPDDTSSGEGGEGGSEAGEVGEAKSGGCDPMTCFMVCGGTCDTDGHCACP